MPGISLLVHGESKTGKSYLGDTCPAPRLILDAEGGSRFTPSKKIEWDPRREKPPQADPLWESCLVPVHDFATITMCYDWLNSGEHPFKSVIIDSISETQQRAVDSLAGVDPMRLTDWGTLFRQVSALVRKFRDLLTHPINPLSAVVLIAMTRDIEGKATPHVQGQLATVLPYYLDIVAYLQTTKDETGTFRRFLMMQPDDRFVAGERVGGIFGSYIEIPYNEFNTINTMIETLNKAEFEKGI